MTIPPNCVSEKLGILGVQKLQTQTSQTLIWYDHFEVVLKSNTLLNGHSQVIILAAVAILKGGFKHIKRQPNA